MLRLLKLVQPCDHDYPDFEIKHKPSPEINFLWAIYDRALRDLDADLELSSAIVHDALRWFKDHHHNCAVPFRYVVAHCKPSQHLLKLTAWKIKLTEERICKEYATRHLLCWH